MMKKQSLSAVPTPWLGPISLVALLGGQLWADSLNKKVKDIEASEDYNQTMQALRIYSAKHRDLINKKLETPSLGEQIVSNIKEYPSLTGGAVGGGFGYLVGPKIFPETDPNMAKLYGTLGGSALGALTGKILSKGIF